MQQGQTEITLTIALVTMNRAGELAKALQSCLACQLPPQTEFVVVDNASDDNTADTVHSILGTSGYIYRYEKLLQNIGAGGGRNKAFMLSRGGYVYMLDDDAVVDAEQNPDFFLRGIEILDKNPQVMTLTTQIFDMAWHKNRVETMRRSCVRGVYEIPMLFGGSHFLRRAFFKEPPYLPNLYGYEELPPSLCVTDAGKINGFCPTLRVIHQPQEDRWDLSKEANRQRLATGFALLYAIKKMMYPRLYTPLLRLAYEGRYQKHLRGQRHLKAYGDALVKEIFAEYPITQKIKFSTVIRMYVKFGLRIF